MIYYGNPNAHCNITRFGFSGCKNILACDIVVTRRALLQCYYDIEICLRHRRHCESLLLKKPNPPHVAVAQTVMLQYNIIAIRCHRRRARKHYDDNDMIAGNENINRHTPPSPSPHTVSSTCNIVLCSFHYYASLEFAFV